MSLVITETSIPLASDADGALRVGGTRVTLDTLVAVFKAGATAEEIVQRYPSLDLGDVYAVIGYYLHHRREVEAYLGHRREQAGAARCRQEAHKAWINRGMSKVRRADGELQGDRELDRVSGTVPCDP